MNKVNVMAISTNSSPSNYPITPVKSNTWGREAGNSTDVSFLRLRTWESIFDE